jgi:hypothetical protein
MKKDRRLISDPNISAFLGIGVGKKKRAEAEAQIAVIQAQAAADAARAKIEADSLALKLAQAQAGFSPEKDKAAADQKALETTATANNTIWYVLAGIVAIVIIGIVIIKLKR